MYIPLLSAARCALANPLYIIRCLLGYSVCNLTLVRVRPLWIFAVDSCVFFAFDRLYFIKNAKFQNNV